MVNDSRVFMSLTTRLLVLKFPVTTPRERRDGPNFPDSRGPSRPGWESRGGFITEGSDTERISGLLPELRPFPALPSPLRENETREDLRSSFSLGKYNEKLTYIIVFVTFLTLELKR